MGSEVKLPQSPACQPPVADTGSGDTVLIIQIEVSIVEKRFLATSQRYNHHPSVDSL